LAGVNPRATFKALLDARLPLYREVAAVEIATDRASPDEIVADVLRTLPHEQCGKSGSPVTQENGR
jgi:shikimate kinase